MLLAPLAGIGNWFVRLQAQRYGAGLAVSEMVSSFAVAHRNRRTVTEMLRIHPDEGPVSIQLFGSDPAVMREAAATVAEARPAMIDLNMGCPVPKVLKTGAGAALLDDHDLAVAVASAAAEGSGLPVTVKLRSGIERATGRASRSPSGWSPRPGCRRDAAPAAPPASATAASPRTGWCASSSTRSTGRTGAGDRLRGAAHRGACPPRVRASRAPTR